MLEADLGSWGPVLAIVAMGCATYLCRIGGLLLMRRVSMTPPLERALTALPGSIVAATIVPIALSSGPAALIGIGCGIVVMRSVRNDVTALLAGLAAASLARVAGL